jgi:nitrogen regulatory protein PII
MTHARKRIEIIVEALHAEQVTDLLDACGASGWTVLPVVSGRDHTGMRRGGDLAGVFDNVLVLCIASAAVADKVLAARDELLGARPAIVSVSDCTVIRAEHFG